jgi:hypothetical protein
LANLEGAQRKVLQESTSNINDLLQLIKVEADRWIEAGARGLAALAQT